MVLLLILRYIFFMCWVCKKVELLIIMEGIEKNFLK